MHRPFLLLVLPVLPTGFSKICHFIDVKFSPALLGTSGDAAVPSPG